MRVKAAKEFAAATRQGGVGVEESVGKSEEGLGKKAAAVDSGGGAGAATGSGSGVSSTGGNTGNKPAGSSSAGESRKKLRKEFWKDAWVKEMPGTHPSPLPPTSPSSLNLPR